MLLAAYLVFLGISHSAFEMANPIRLGEDRVFRSTNGKPYYPLGGFHGNVIPIERLNLTDQERQQFEPHLWNGHIDLFDATEPVLHQWFQFLSELGVNALRLFPRARVGLEVLDSCGKIHPELQAAFARVFRIAAEYDIRFLLQVLPEPGRTGYLNREALEQHVLPHYSPEELASLTPAQRRFLIDRRTVSIREYFTDPDVLACQQLYLERVLRWIAAESQVFALEIYNEQAWMGIPTDGTSKLGYGFAWEDEEIAWSRKIVQTIRRYLPEMPVCLSHPGFGITGFDPFKWSEGAGVDFYSSHLYAGLCGADAEIDFAAVTAATTAIIGARWINFPGEWGILNSKAPEEIRLRGHRDSIWLTLLTGAPGFMQWEFDFPEEYRWPSRILAALPSDFRPSPQLRCEDISATYPVFQDNTRYPGYTTEGWFDPWAFNRAKQRDPNLRQMLRSYQQALVEGEPLSYSMGVRDATPQASEPAPIRVEGGYQLTWVCDAQRSFWLGYLRSRRIEAFGGHFLGVPVARQLTLHLNLPSDAVYELRLVNLATDEVQCWAVERRTTVRVTAETSDDYVLFLSISETVPPFGE